MATEPRIRVSALLLWRDRILLCRHEKPGKEYWLLPGGGVNSGESLVDALRRELSEEVGLDDMLSFEGPIAIVGCHGGHRLDPAIRAQHPVVRVVVHLPQTQRLRPRRDRRRPRRLGTRGPSPRAARREMPPRADHIDG